MIHNSKQTQIKKNPLFNRLNREIKVIDIKKTEKNILIKIINRMIVQGEEMETTKTVVMGFVNVVEIGMIAKAIAQEVIGNNVEEDIVAMKIEVVKERVTRSQIIEGLM